MKNILSKEYDLLKNTSIIIGELALKMSSASTSMCPVVLFHEPEMPKSLYENEE